MAQGRIDFARASENEQGSRRQGLWEKAAVSHRGKALEIFDVKLREYLKKQN